MLLPKRSGGGARAHVPEQLLVIEPIQYQAILKYAFEIFFRDLPPLFRNMVSLTIPSLCNLYLWPVLNNLFEDLHVTSDFLQS